MSIYKEAEIAMEFLQDEVIPPSEFEVHVAPDLQSAEDLLTWVEADSTLGKQDRINQMSAIRALAKVQGIPMGAIPLDEANLFRCYGAIRADRSMTKLRRSNIITLLNRVLKRAGLIKVGSRRMGKTTLSWVKLIDLLPHKEDQRGLSTFAKFCSEKGIDPEQVTREVWEDFASETLTRSTFRRPRATVRRVIAASNRARAARHDWPLPEFSKLKSPRLMSIPKDELPPSFWADLDAYVERSSTPTTDIFDDTSPAQLSPNTLRRYRDVAWRTASAQVHAGRPAAEIVSLSALMDEEWLKRAMRWLHARAGNKFLKDHLNTAATWVSFADNYVRPPKPVRDALRRIMKTIDTALGKPEFSRKNIERLDQFTDQATVNDLLLLPYRIFDEISRKKEITVEDATDMMAAVAIELLLTTMIRRKNLARADLKANFWPSKPRPDGRWAFRVEGKDVKNLKPLDFPLMPSTTRLIQFYLKRCWPVLQKEPGSKLFLRKNGKLKGSEGVAHLVRRVVRQRLDLDVNVHLFRHIGAMLYLDEHPGNLEVVRVMLGHGSTKTTQQFYARMKATRAIELFTKTVLGERDALIAKLKLGKRGL